MQRSAIDEILSHHCVLVPLKSTDAKGAVLELLNALIEDARIPDGAQVKQAVLRAEQKFHSGLDHGVAIPHAKDDNIDELVMAFGVAPNPIDFAATDGHKCDVVFLMVYPDRRHGDFVQALARIRHLASQPAFHQSIRKARNARHALEIIHTHDAPSGQLLEIPD